MKPPNLVLLPGLDGTGILFRPLLAALPQEIRPKVVVYPGCERRSLKEHAALVAHEMPDEEVVVLAESFSGLVALQLLASGPAQIKKVLFVGSFARPPQRLLWVAPYFPGAGLALQMAPDIVLRRYCLGSDATAELLALLREAIGAVAPQIMVQRLGLIAAAPSFDAMRFQVPCCYLRGSRDRLVPPTAAGWFQEHFDDCKVETMDGPHFLLQARAQECAAWIVEQARSLQARG